jgi:hypothetical protein
VHARAITTALVFGLLILSTARVSAQVALAATSVDRSRLPPPSRLTLRPAPGLEAIASSVARVLALRSDIKVEIGRPPPPDVLEAVPVGNVALARDGNSILLVMGAALGQSYEAHLALGPDGKADTRALALAIEALRDRAIEARERLEDAARERDDDARLGLAREAGPREGLDANGDPRSALGEQASNAPVTRLSPDDAELLHRSDSQTDASLPLLPRRAEPRPHLIFDRTASERQRDDGSPYRLEYSEPPSRVEPVLYARVYGGGSTESNALRTGVGVGGGLCVKGQCLLLAAEYPLPIALEAGGNDIRYRYPTFSCSFYSRPVKFGRFTPAAGIGLLSRIGHFERDMGIAHYNPNLETDLGVRGVLEGAFEIVEAVDLVAEAGLDYALDRWLLGHGDSVAYRGDRATPWLQGGIRIRAQ